MHCSVSPASDQIFSNGLLFGAKGTQPDAHLHNTALTAIWVCPTCWTSWPMHTHSSSQLWLHTQTWSIVPPKVAFRLGCGNRALLLWAIMKQAQVDQHLGQVATSSQRSDTNADGPEIQPCMRLLGSPPQTYPQPLNTQHNHCRSYRNIHILWILLLRMSEQ